jgi:hypothetical protein
VLYRTGVFLYKMGFCGAYKICQNMMSPLDERFPYTAFAEYIYEVA